MEKRQYTYTHRGHQIVPKRDFGTHGHLINGKIVKRGWVVVKDHCNIMPGATWFQTPSRARHAINVLLRVKGNADRFWEIMQPFPYKRVGQKSTERDCTIRKGRFFVRIENHRVVEYRDDLNPNGL